MKRTLALTLLILAACGGGEAKDGSAAAQLSRTPVSVRGWVLDVKDARSADNIDMELARRAQLFAATSLWIEGSRYASGGIAENGAFIVLDVPPGTSTLGFNAPGAETAKIVMENVPGNADVMLPNVILENGGATFLDPSQLVVRLPDSSVDKPTPTGEYATFNGVRAPIVKTPLREMMNRREYPEPPGYRPLATVR